MKTSSLHRQLFRWLRWNRTSYTLLSTFLVIAGLVIYAWWPLVKEYAASFNPALPLWRQFDWLLLADFLVMTLLIMAGADLRYDIPVALVGAAGGLVIESWGTQTNLWFYYTAERPPLWIIPAWPIATLAIDRIYHLLRNWCEHLPERPFIWLYWLTFGGFYALMLWFVWPSVEHSLTIMALGLCAFLIFTGKDKRFAVLIFIAGSALGYFLELWGTTRQCWTYYTRQAPPFFAVLAHGMAAVAFWRVSEIYRLLAGRFSSPESTLTRDENLPPVISG